MKLKMYEFAIAGQFDPWIKGHVRHACAIRGRDCFERILISNQLHQARIKRDRYTF
jgi:hypothetical protein